MHESTVQKLIRLEAARLGNNLYRNNSGACIDQTGRMIRYGLANESKQLNKYIKSSDLIGDTQIMAYVENLGWLKLAVFTAIECKPSGWKFNSNNEREVAQAKFHEITIAAGGKAGFATNVEDYRRIIGL